MRYSKPFNKLYEQLLRDFERDLRRPLTTGECQLLEQIARKQEG